MSATVTIARDVNQQIGSCPRRRIAFFDHTSLMSGGEVALLNLVTTLDKNVYEPTVILCAEGPLADNLRLAGVETHILPLSESVLKTRKDTLGIGSLVQLKKVSSLVSYTLKLAQFLREIDIDLVHTNSLKSDIIGAVAGRIAKLPVVWHVRDRIAGDYLPPPVARTFAWLSTFLPNHVITISHATRKALPENSQQKNARLKQFSVVHDGVNKNVFRNTPRQWQPHDAVVVGIVGRISPWKGQHVFIKAASYVHRKFPNARFQIIGGAMFEEHDYEREVQELVVENNLRDVVEFLGFRQDIIEVMEKLDVVVHASTIGEPFGQVIVEGMALGKPVVATNGGAVPEIIEDNVSGLLVPPSDEIALAQRLIALLEDPERARKIGKSGQERVKKCFSIEQTAQGVEKIYEQIFSQAKT